MTQNELEKWEERHFELIKAIAQGAASSSRFSSSDLYTYMPDCIVKTADKIIEKLKYNANYSTSESKTQETRIL